MSDKKSGRGVRYTDEQKQEVMDFVHNNPGRGAMKQALEKFGVSYIAIRNWLENSGQTRPERANKEERKTRLEEKADTTRFDKARKLIDKIQETESELRGLYVDLAALLR